jgi:hypothetical protein
MSDVWPFSVGYFIRGGVEGGESPVGAGRSGRA